MAAPPQPAITEVLLKRRGRWCSHNETLWIRPASYSMLSGSEMKTGHFSSFTNLLSLPLTIAGLSDNESNSLN